MEKKIREIYNNKIIDKWIEPDAPKEETDENYKDLNLVMDSMYRFVLSYSNYFNQRRDYGAGPELTMVEVHILTNISDNPGTTVTAIAKDWNRTTSAISQTIRKLLKQKLITRENSEENGKIYYLYTTELGEEVTLAHKRYDNIDILKTNKKLLETLTVDDLISFDKVCRLYNDLLTSAKEK